MVYKEDYYNEVMSMQERYLCRAKRIDNGKWVEGFYFCMTHPDGRHTHHFIIPLGADLSRGTPIEKIQVEADPSTICRCTGLRDKNDELIWEKDIVDGHIKRGAAFLNCLVLWNECKARFDVRAMDCNFPMTLDEVVDDISICGLDYEVIGNTFDNPELLEV